jgi:hypothetical protein
MIGFGQTDDVLELQTDVDNINYRMKKHHNKLQNDVDNINYKMEKHYKQFYTGVTLNFAGFGVTTIGALISINPIIYIGGAVILAGNIIIVDSHKWFKNIDITADRIKKRTKQLDLWLESGEITKKEYNDAIKDLKSLKQ